MGEYVFGQVPFGYEKSRELKNTVVVNEKEAEIVRYIFALAIGGNGSTQIARILNERGYPPKHRCATLRGQGKAAGCRHGITSLSGLS